MSESTNKEFSNDHLIEIKIKGNYDLNLIDLPGLKEVEDRELNYMDKKIFKQALNETFQVISKVIIIFTNITWIKNYSNKL